MKRFIGLAVIGLLLVASPVWAQDADHGIVVIQLQNAPKTFSNRVRVLVRIAQELKDVEGVAQVEVEVFPAQVRVITDPGTHVYLLAGVLLDMGLKVVGYQNVEVASSE